MGKKAIFLIIPLILTIGITPAFDLIPEADALKAKKVTQPVYGSATKIVCGDRLCSEVPGGYEAWKESQKESSRVESPTAPAPEMEDKEMETMEEEAMDKTMEEEAMDKTMEEATMKDTMKATMKPHGWITATGTLDSVTDPGLGHESHQLAIILPPTDMIYKGILSYGASEPIQLVALHGPLAEGEDNGQPIWTPDGETKFALTFIDPEDSMGSWLFTGNALAVHTMNEETFTVSYSVSYMEKETSETVMTGTLSSMVDPGMAHETHQLTIILPPNEKTYSGLLTYSASEPIQLVALHGPLAEGEDKGQKIWTPDGDTKFALTLVNPESDMGTWAFAGNALAVHTMNEDTFTISYSVVAGLN